jgi:tRNA(Ile)-lysidine synthase
MTRRKVDIAHHPFVKALARGLRRRCGVREGNRLLVAVSGGADSVALLRGLAALAPRRGWRLQLAVGHVQHHLRAARHAEGDARFVARLAEKLDLPFFRADLRPPRRASGGGGGGGGGNREAWARQARYQALSTMAQGFGAHLVVAAHHGDDQLETVFMRLLRGASVRGLAGMHWRRRIDLPKQGETNSDSSTRAERAPARGQQTLQTTAAGSGPVEQGTPMILIRPLLALDRQDVRRFLGDIGQDWREDHTNADVTRLRAALRHRVLPALREIHPGAARKTVRLADHFRQVAALLDRAVSAAENRVLRRRGRAEMHRTEARLLEPVVLTGLLRRLLGDAGVPPDRLGARAVRPICRAIRDHTGGRRRFTLHGAVKVTVEREKVTIGDLKSEI